MSQELDFTPQEEDVDMLAEDTNEPAVSEEEELADSGNEAQEDPYPPQEMDVDMDTDDTDNPSDEKSGTRPRLNVIIGTTVRPEHFKAIYVPEAGSTSKLTKVFWTVVLDYVATRVATRMQEEGAISPDHVFPKFFSTVRQIFPVVKDLSAGMLQESDFISSKYAVKKPVKPVVKKQENPPEPEKQAKKKKKNTLPFVVTAKEIFAAFKLQVPVGTSAEFKHRFAYALGRVALFIARRIKTHSQAYKKQQVKLKHCRAILGAMTKGDTFSLLLKKTTVAIQTAGVLPTERTKSEPASE